MWPCSLLTLGHPVFSRHFNNVPCCISGYPPTYAGGQLTVTTKPILPHFIYIRKHFLSPLFIYLIRISFLLLILSLCLYFILFYTNFFRIHFPPQYTLILLECISISIFIFAFSNCILTCPYFPCQNRSIRLHTCTTIDNTTFCPSTHFLTLPSLLTSSPAIKILAST